jgi:hypothetical protein
VSEADNGYPAAVRFISLNRNRRPAKLIHERRSNFQRRIAVDV